MLFLINIYIYTYLFLFIFLGFREYLLPNLDLGNNRHLLSAKISDQNNSFKLIDFDFIRKRISKNQQIELTLVDIADLHEQIVEGFFIYIKNI